MALHILYQNVRGLRTKLPNFKLSVIAGSFDMIAVTETWLNDNISDEELADDNYNIFRRDRDLIQTKKKDGGGVLLLVRDNLSAKCVPEMSSDFEDL